MSETKKYYHNLDVDKNKITNLLLNPLTTAQRDAVGSNLNFSDKGYVCYDTTLNLQYFWNGSGWVPTTVATAWGNIIGTITSQADLISYLSTNYYSVTNPAGYITSAALSPYLLSTTAASTYVPLTRKLTINGVEYDLSADRSWTIDALPSQTGNAGEFLTTDGEVASWATIPPSETSANVIADVSVGAINAGQTIPIGTNIQELVEQIFSQTFNPSFVAPTFSLSNNAGTREIGSTASITLTFNFNRGGIYGSTSGTWNPSFFQNYRAGASSSYTINGVTQPGNTLSISVTFAASNTYSGTVTYDIGPQPLNSKGNNYSTPLAGGTSLSQSTSFTAIYPYFYYKSSSPITAADMQTAIANGTATKVLASSAGTISIPFVAAGEYIAVAYPGTSTTKTIWYVNALDNGTIPGGVFGAVTSLPCNSPSSFWTGVSYKIHVSPGLITQANPIELRNS